MKLSVEGKVAASVAAGFVALTVGVIAEGDSEGQIAGQNEYRRTNTPEVNTYRSQPAYNSSLIAHTIAGADEGN